MRARTDYRDDYGIISYLKTHPNRSYKARQIARELGLTCQTVAQFLRRHDGIEVQVAKMGHKKYYKWRPVP